MTVKELKKLLSEYPEYMEVALHLDFGKWREITRVGEAMECIATDNGDGTFNDKVTIKFVGIQ